MENIHYNEMMVKADLNNWREKTAEIIGEESVDFQLKDDSRTYPIVQISSTDRSALTRVLDRAVEQ